MISRTKQAKQPLSLIVDPGPGREAKCGRETRREWIVAPTILRPLLEELGMSGEYKLRPGQKGTWRGVSKCRVPIKVGEYDLQWHGIALTMGVNHGTVSWEFYLTPPHGVNGVALRDQLHTLVKRLNGEALGGEPDLDQMITAAEAVAEGKHQLSLSEQTDQEEFEMPKASAPDPAPAPVPVPAVAPPPALPTVVDDGSFDCSALRQKLDHLEQEALRVKQRRLELDNIAAEKQQLQSQIDGLRQQLEELELRELAIMEAGEQDAKAQEAIQMLRSLEAFFKR
jgi:hypothetical protein